MQHKSHGHRHRLAGTNILDMQEVTTCNSLTIYIYSHPVHTRLAGTNVLDMQEVTTCNNMQRLEVNHSIQTLQILFLAEVLTKLRNRPMLIPLVSCKLVTRVGGLIIQAIHHISVITKYIEAKSVSFFQLFRNDFPRRFTSITISGITPLHV